MSLEGKGFYIWQVRSCEKGDAEKIALLAQQAALTHVLIKIADGAFPYNYDWKTQKDLALPVVRALQERGIVVWGWHYVYGEKPRDEARIAIRRILELGVQGYAIDAEKEYKDRNKKGAANLFMNDLRKELKDLPIALASYRFPSYHTLLPWKEFLNQCDFNMPQMYWVKSNNPAEQLKRCVREFQEITPFRPIIPTGAAFSEHQWTPTESEIIEFLQTAESLNLKAANFWSWDYCRNRLPHLWNTIADYPWAGELTPDPLITQWIQFLNSHDTRNLAQLYHPDAVHITAQRTIQGREAIQNWYQDLIEKQIPKASFTLSGWHGKDNSRLVYWRAKSSSAVIDDGKDTFGLQEGKIIYHYTQFSIKSNSPKMQSSMI